MALDGLNLGVGGHLRLGGGSSPSVVGAGTPGVSVAQGAYGAGSTSPTGGGNGIFGTSAGHITIYSGGIALILLVLIRHSLPR